MLQISSGEEGWRTDGGLDSSWITNGTKGVDFAGNLELFDFATVHLCKPLSTRHSADMLVMSLLSGSTVLPKSCIAAIVEALELLHADPGNWEVPYYVAADFATEFVYQRAKVAQAANKPFILEETGKAVRPLFFCRAMLASILSDDPNRRVYVHASYISG